MPTGAIYDFMAPYTLVGFTKVAEEQGIWAAQTAIRILSGTKPSDIPITENKQYKVIWNERIATKLGAALDPAIAKIAEIVR